VQRSGGSTARGLLAAACSAVLAVAALAGCSGGSGTNNAGADSKQAGSTASVSAAPPGKYRVLPEPCGSVGQNTLKALLPESSDYAGQATLTFDTDRRVGCNWSGKTDRGTRNLSIDIERAVSYDPTVSDEDEARQQYDKEAVAAGVPASSPSASSSATASPTASASASASLSAAATASTSASDSAAPAPRVLSGLGNSAFLNDVLTTKDSGVHRDVTVVFRKANVLVTLVFSQWSTDNSVTPGSQELQDGARKAAGEIAGQFS
jgi:hypothetical protein